MTGMTWADAQACAKRCSLWCKRLWVWQGWAADRRQTAADDEADGQNVIRSPMATDVQAPKHPSSPCSVTAATLTRSEARRGWCRWSGTLMELLRGSIADPCLTALQDHVHDLLSRLSARARCASRHPWSGDWRAGRTGKSSKPGLTRVDADRSFEHDRSAERVSSKILPIVPAKGSGTLLRVEGQKGIVEPARAASPRTRRSRLFGRSSP